MMLGYYGRLALGRVRRSPSQALLMVLALGFGIGACVLMLTVYDAVSRNPLGSKGDRIFSVTIDSWGPDEPFDTDKPALPPPELTYQDSAALLLSTVPTRKAAMVRTEDVISATPGGVAIPIATRVTGADFFPMFDVPFLYGNGWQARHDEGAGEVIVLSRALNQKLFGDVNSVGRTVFWDRKPMRVVGVLDTWDPLPKFYDLWEGAFSQPEDAYVPFGWVLARGRIPDGGAIGCWPEGPIGSLAQFLQSGCVVMQLWVELDTPAAVQLMQNYLDSYWADQHKVGRFPRPRNNRITDVTQWLTDQRVVSDDNRVLVGVAVAFLVICLLNTGAVLLSQFLKQAHSSSVRRALGASRGQIFLQHLVEAGLVAGAGGALGLILSTVSLFMVHAIFASASVGRSGYQQIMHVSVDSVVWTFVLSVLCTLAVGLYPAWRVGMIAPASGLKED